MQAAVGAASAQSPPASNFSDVTAVGPPVTVNFSSFQTGSNDVPLSDPRLAKTANATEPEQIHVSLGGAEQSCVHAGLFIKSFS